MTREERDQLKRELVRQHPELAERIMGIRAVEQSRRGTRNPAVPLARAGPKSGANKSWAGPR
jgi:hypothetical protein